MTARRVTLFAGHYGSGKTNIAVNYARLLADQGHSVTLADLDIVNPYFRAKDSAVELERRGVWLISSPYANSNVDIPALPQEMYTVIDDKSRHAVLDIGGDDRGALALGRYAPGILAEGDYEMLLVVNCYRPLSRDAESAMAIMAEIERAGGIPFTAIVNNSNLGAETAAADVLASVPYAEEIARRTGLPIRMTGVVHTLAPKLEGKLPDLLPLELQQHSFF